MAILVLACADGDLLSATEPVDIYAVRTVILRTDLTQITEHIPFPTSISIPLVQTYILQIQFESLWDLPHLISRLE